MAFITAFIVALAALALQALVIMAEASKPIPDSGFMGLFWPAVIGFPLAAFIAASHWLPHIGW